MQASANLEIHLVYSWYESPTWFGDHVPLPLRMTALYHIFVFFSTFIPPNMRFSVDFPLIFPWMIGTMTTISAGGHTGVMGGCCVSQSGYMMIYFAFICMISYQQLSQKPPWIKGDRGPAYVLRLPSINHTFHLSHQNWVVPRQVKRMDGVHKYSRRTPWKLWKSSQISPDLTIATGIPGVKCLSKFC